MRVPIAVRLWLLLVLPVIALAVVAAVLVVERLREATVERSSIELMDLVSAYASASDLQLRRVEAVVDTLAHVLTPDHQPGFDAFSAPQLSALLERAVQADPQLTGLVVAFEPNAYGGTERELFAPYAFTRDGELFTLDVADKYDYRLEDNAWYTQARDGGKPLWIDLVWGKAGQQWYTEYMVPIFDGSAFRAVVGAVVSPSDLGGNLGDHHALPGDLIMFSANGRIVYHSNKSVVAMPIKKAAVRSGDAFDLSAVHEAALKGSGALERVGPPEAAYLVASDHLDSIDWTLALVISERELLAGAEDSRGTMLWFVFAVALLLSASSLLGTRQLVQPISRLRRAVHETGQGNFDAPVDERSGGEIGDLAASFESMRKLLRANAERLEATNERLAEANLASERARTLVQEAIEALDVGFVMFDAQERLVLFNSKLCELDPRLEPVLRPGVTFADIVASVYEEQRAASSRGIGLEEFVSEQCARFRARCRGDVYKVDERWLMITDATTPEGGAARVITDVTDLKLTQAMLEKARDQSDAGARAKSAFLATMSHEIRTPLNGVIGTIDLLELTRLSDDQGEMVHTIRESSVALLTIINDILDYSKIEAGRMALELRAIDLLAAVEGVGKALQPVATAKGIALNTYVDPAIPSALLADSVRLRQVLFNLAGNAVKFTESGSVLLTARPLEADRETGDLRVEFRVKDTGIGLSEEAAARLFQEYTQADQSTSRRFGGTGLGLAISKRLVNLMGGSISVVSEPDVGSEFAFSIALSPAAEQPDGQRNLRNLDDLSGLQVLIAAPQSDVAPLLSSYLRSSGAEVEVTGSVEAFQAALAAAPERPLAPGIALVAGEWSESAMGLLVEAFQRIHASTRYKLVLPADAARAAATDLADGLTFANVLPLRRKKLIRAVAVAAGRASPDIEYASTLTEAAAINEHAHREELQSLGTVLVAEDNSLNRRVVTRQLDLLGVAHEMVEDGQAAIEALANGSYALLLTDCHMPVMDGYDLARRVRTMDLRAANGVGAMPVIAFTASALPEEVERCYRAGMNDVIAKPASIVDLRSKLKQWLRTGSAVADVGVPPEG